MFVQDTHKPFFDELKAVLKKYDVELIARDNGKPYGAHTPLIEIWVGDVEYNATLISGDSCEPYEA
jgi:tetrahydromethanopterin S-methyltransferase subunit F